MKIVSLEEVKEYLRLDDETSDIEVTGLIEAAEEYLENATERAYTAEEGKTYYLEKIYLKLLVAQWFEHRSPVGTAGEEFTYMTKSLMLQLQNK